MTRNHSLTTGDIAKYCDVNLRTVIRWINKGSLKAYKLPGRGNNRVQIQDFLLFLNENNMPVPDDLKSAKRDVLIVDDEPAYAKAIKRVLSKAGFECSIANGGFQAGLMLNANQPTLMTLDLSMPGVDGFEVLTFARQQESVAQTKIIVISALDKPSLQKALDLGADAVISKPFQNEDLLKVIDDVIKQ
jgi:excisionase family DNA binding protein